MINSISSGNPIVNIHPVAADQASQKPQVAQKPQAAPQVAPQVVPQSTRTAADAPKPDVVQLSDPAQARLLRQQGMSIEEIALKLGLDVTTVTGYFQEGGLA